MSTTKVDTLRVPGASLYYEVRGSGPILLMIAAGSEDAGSYHRLAEHLVDHYTVVTYDRRGYSRSPLDDPEQPVGIETNSEDAHRLLAALTTEPAYVLGCSIGALIGLDLAIRHPEQVRTLVAHEPPVRGLLPDDEKRPNLLEMYRREGAVAAIKKFAASIGMNHDDQRSNIGLFQERDRIAKNLDSFFKYDVGAVSRYTLDVAALRAAPTRIVIAGGRAGREYFPYRCAARVAELLGTAIVEFPGNHMGFVNDPREFAARLCEVLGH
jgi:pimeloyl-ACP methyl ester carboxylesterase